jgi:hypothetical protein
MERAINIAGAEYLDDKKGWMILVKNGIEFLTFETI